MTTPEFIKLIKAYNKRTSKLHGLNWDTSDPSYLISENELNKIEKVNVELLKALTGLLNDYECYISGRKGVGYIEVAKEAIKNANNIKQI